MPVRKCLYEELGVSQNADEGEIRRAYRQAALQCHPDKNRGAGEEAAEERFKAVQHAYEVLSDPHERSWYDSHRASILKGREVNVDGDGEQATAGEATGLDLFSFFTSTAYSGFSDDDSSSFYGVYSEVFNTLAAEERSAGMTQRMPTFGRGGDEWPSVRDFYRNWEGFSSRKTFGFADKWNLAEAPNRDYRRAMERENKRERAKVKKEFNELVRDLVAFVRKRDPRVKAQKDAEKERQDEREAAARRRQVQDSADRKARAAESRAQRDAVLEEDAEELDRILEELAIDEEMDLQGRRRGKRGRRLPNQLEVEGDVDAGEEFDGSEGDCAAEDVFVQNGANSLGQREKSGAPSGERGEGYNLETVGLEQARESSDGSQGEEDLYCVACRKLFKSQAQKSNHEQSRKHLAAVAKLRDQLLREDAQFAEENGTKTVHKSSVRADDGQGALQHESYEPEEGDASITGEGATMLPMSKKARKKARAVQRLQEQASDTSKGERVAKEQQTSAARTGDVNTAEDTAAFAPDAKAKRKALRKEKRKEKAATANRDEASDGKQHGNTEWRCNVCNNSFPSRSKLFTHIKEKGHALAEPGSSGRRRT